MNNYGLEIKINPIYLLFSGKRGYIENYFIFWDYTRNIFSVL